MSFMPINPRPMLQDLVNKDIVVRLKWGETEYKGRLVSIDSYMNIQLTNAQEFIDQKFTSDLGQILIRYVPCCWGLFVVLGGRVSRLTRDEFSTIGATTCYGLRARLKARTATPR
ncbi:hypothetical protein SLS62_001705 [Diatrype stigma]|uniref:Sm protein F n=1 Tax=Diatrype stigma TaxID=117547 RepID=A0AAN9V8F6_9PEZI